MDVETLLHLIVASGCQMDGDVDDLVGAMESVSLFAQAAKWMPPSVARSKVVKPSSRRGRRNDY